MEALGLRIDVDEVSVGPGALELVEVGAPVLAPVRVIPEPQPD